MVVGLVGFLLLVVYVVGEFLLMCCLVLIYFDVDDCFVISGLLMFYLL